MSDLEVAGELLGDDDRPGFLEGFPIGEEGAEEVMNNLFNSDDFENIRKFVGEGADMKLNESGEPVLKTAEGREINMKSVHDSFAEGDTVSGFKKFFGEDLSDELQKLAEERDASFKETEQGKIQQSAKDAEKANEKSDPTDAEDFKIQVNNYYGDIYNGDVIKEADEDVANAKLDENGKPLDPKTAEGKEQLEKNTKKFCEKWTGKLLKLGLQLAVLAIALYLAHDFYEFIKNMSHVLSGCWATTANTSCKIQQLTCNKQDQRLSNDTAIFSSKDYQFCTACENVNKPDGTCNWIPLHVPDACQCNSNDPYPGAYNPDALTGKNICSGGTNPKCPIKETFDMRASANDSACANASGCITYTEACPDPSAVCSNWCDNSQLILLPGQTVDCRKCGFWCAFQQATGNVLHLPSGLLSKMEKILMYIAIGIVVLIFGYIILKELFTWGMDELDGPPSHGGSEQTVHIKISDDHGAHVAFGKRRRKIA